MVLVDPVEVDRDHVTGPEIAEAILKRDFLFR
jgi:hypothetical protein